MSGPPNWNPPLQTSSVRFPRKAVETPQVPPNTTARPRPGTLFQPVYPNPITQIPAITAEVTGCGKILDNLYLLNNGTGEAVPYNVTRQTMRGVPIPTVITVATSERYIVFGIDFPYRMSGTDHFVFTFTNQNTNEQSIKNYQPAAQYLVSGLEPGIVYTLTVSPYVNGINYPASPPTNPFTISAISEKNIELRGVTLSGGDRSAIISFTGAIPGPPIALAVSNIAIDDNFRNAQLRFNLGPSPPRPVNTGIVTVGNLTNGSSYTFTVTPYGEMDGIFEYGLPTTLLPYIPGPPSDLFINSITANTTTAFLNTTYDTLVHPTPVSNRVELWESTFTTICSLVSRPVTAVQDLSQTYAAFTTLSSLFTPADITYLKSTVSANPGIVQVDITDNTGLWYSFPLANVSGGGIGYVFENSNFTKTQGLDPTAKSSYTLLFRQVNLGTQICSQTFSPPQTTFTYNGILSKKNHTFVGLNFANGLPSLRTSYATVAVGEPLFPTNITGISGSHIVSISFTGYNPTLAIPGPKPTFFRYSDNYGNTYTTINSNIVINGLTDTSLYTFTIAGFGNGVYGNTAQYSITPGVRPPTSLSVLAVSNYDVTLSFSPGLGGADFYAVVTQNGLAQSASAFPYKIQGLSADVSYFFGAVSFAYRSPVYSISSSVSANLIQEISSSYAQFLISPSGFPYAAGIQQGRTEFVPYLYTITASGQSPAPPTVNVTNFLLTNIFPVGTSLFASNSISTLALVQSGVSAGIAYTVTTSGVSYTLTSIGVSGGYYVLNGGPSTLISLSGQVLSLSVTPISNTLTFPITSVTTIYDGSGNITAYNVENPSILKSKTTFSGATVYRTTISAIIPFFSGMTPTTFTGTVSSSTFVTAGRSPTFVGPPNTVIFTASSYSSQRVDLEVEVSGNVSPLFYAYTELSGKVAPGTSVSSPIVLTGLTNGSSYTFSVRAFGNQVFSVCAARTRQFDLCTNAPQNVVASFFSVRPSISYSISYPPSDSYVAELFNGNTIIQNLTRSSEGSFVFPNTVAPTTKYNFRIYGILNGISSTTCNITGIISGPPAQPILRTTVLTSGQIVFNWSSGNVDYSERFRITEYLSNNGVFPTGGQWANISGFTYTVSALVTASGTQAFSPTNWIELSPGFASFVLSNDPYSFLSTINNTYRSNQIYLTFQQSGGITYTFPLTNILPYNTLSNIYTNPNYPKETTDIFNPALSLSVTYSYGTGPFNYGKYFYTLNSFANQVFGPSAGISVQMFVEPVNGIPTVSVTGSTATTATVSFAQTAITGSVYRVTNNYGSNVSVAPYAFTNLPTGRPYTFSVVVSNGAFVSISSASSIPIYVGPPSAPIVSTSYYGPTSTVLVTDTTLSLASVFFDSGKQGTDSNIVTPSHTNVIQQTSGGFWVGIGAGFNGNIKDTLSGFVSSAIGAGTVGYSNDGIANAMYQFTVTPSTGTMAVSLSSYRLFVSGTSVVISNGSTQVYSATITASSYPIQFVSRSVAFGIQSGLSSFFYTSVPASSDLLTISLGGAASFSDYRVYSLNNVGVPASSYTITDQFNTVYNPTLVYTVYSLAGITYAYNLLNIVQNQTFTLSVRPFGNGVGGPAGSALLYINTETPTAPNITSLVDTSATVVLQGVQSTPPIETYSLIEYENETAKSIQTQPAAYSPYAVPGLSMWLDAADTTTITSNATTGITRWTDKSINGYNAIPAMFTIPGCVVWVNPGYGWDSFGVVTSVPNFGTAGGNLTAGAGTGTVTKIGISYPSYSYLSFAAGSSMSLPQIRYTQTSRTVFAVVTVGPTGGARQFLTGGQNSRDIQFYSFNTNLELNYSGVRLQRASSPQNFFSSTSILSATSTTADRGIYVNGTAQTTDINNTESYSTGDTTTQVIGNGGAAFDLYEMLVFDGALTTTQRQQVEGYLAYKYNLQSRLPLSHPYFTIPFQRVFTVGITPPAITTTIQNGLNAIATNTGILTVNNFNWTSYSTVFFVVKSSNISYFAGTAASSYVGYIATFNYGLFSTGVANFNDSVLPRGTQVIPVNQWCLFSIGYGGGTQATNYAVNGTPRSTTTAPPGSYTSTTAPLWLSAWGPDSIYGGDNITIGEVIHYNRSITTQERQGIESYLANKWGLELGLPPNTVPGLTLWLDAADPNATGVVTNNGATIATWRDKSGLGSDSTATGTPTIISTGLNNRPTMNFNGTSWFKGPTANTTSNLTVFAVVMLSGNAVNNSRIVSLAAPTKTDYDTFAEVLVLQQGGSRTWISTGRNTQPPGVTTSFNFIQSTDTTTISNVPYIAVARYSGTDLSQTLFVNGSSKSTGFTTGAFGYTSYGIGNYAGLGSEPFTGKISEVLIYNAALTTVQRQNIESYLANKWGLTVAAASPRRIPTAPPTPTLYTFRYPNLINHSNYYFRAYATRFDVSSALSAASSPTVEAGRPYQFFGLTASLLNPNATVGTYTLSATVNVGANSNGTIRLSVDGNSRVVSQTVTITTSADQQYVFTVSGGARYTLTSLAVMNSMSQLGPTITINAVPFRPLGVSLTISTANLGSTYGGIINVTTPSPTTGVTYFYAHSSNNGATVTSLTTNNAFTALYGSTSNYIGYVYSCNAALGLLSTASAVTTTCNVFLSPPSNAVATYNGTNITVNWSGNTIGSLYYTVREKDGKLPIQTNIATPPLRTTFIGTTGSSYIFEVAAQSDLSRASSAIYSTFIQSTSINLTTLSAAPVTINYTGNTIALSWANRGSGYIYTVSQMIGPSLGNINQPNSGQNTLDIQNVPIFNTYQFAVQTLFNGISGVTSFSPSITLSTAALTNVSQSYVGNLGGTVSYTISWNPYAPPTDNTSANYIVRDVSGNPFRVSGSSINLTSFTTADTSAAFTLARTVSSYTFQVNASYKGISGPITTLSAIYMDVNAPPTPPITTYSNSNITVSWSAAVQPDGNSRPDNYFVYDTIGETLSSTVSGISNSVNLTATVGLSYQFTVTSTYKGITSPTGLCGEIIRVFTPPPTNVVITNSGANLVINWTSSINSPSATYSISQARGPTVIPSGFTDVGTATSYTSPSPVTTLSDTIFYNFTIVALSNGLSSAPASASTPVFVYTYPVTNVFIYYSNTQLFARWTRNPNQPNAVFNATAYLLSTTEQIGSVNTEPEISSIRIGPGVSNSSYYANVYATNNNLRQSIPPETTSLNSVRLFTAPPIFNGIGFNGNYAITVNMSSGPQATTDRLRSPDTYILTEVNNLFFPNASSWTFPPAEVYTIPTLGTQGLTYNFNLYATLCGLASLVASPSGTIQLRLTTNPVPANSVVADYFGTTVTITWAKAIQNNVGDPNSAPNGGYTIYVSSQGFPVTSLYSDTSIKFIGEAGESYQFSIAAVNNNVGSSLTTGASAVVLLYRPVVDFLSVTNSGAIDNGRYYANMILTWVPDDINAPNAVYTGTARNQTTGRIEQTLSTSTASTLIFNGSLGTSYILTLTGRYKGINGNPSTVQISNARPILTVEPLINIGNIITVNYSANEEFSSFDVSAIATNGGSILCNIITTSAFASWRVTTSTGGFGYSVSTTAFFNGIPSTTIARTISLTEPAAPASITFRYNNALVSVSWSPVTTNVSSYTFIAYDLSADPPILTSSQPGLFATSTSFIGILGHTYNVSAFALSSNNIISLGRETTATIEIPPAPSGSLVLSNTGTLVSVNWLTSAGYGYAFYVSNVAQRGTIIYSNLFALPGDTFIGVIGDTYSVSLFQVSPSNVTSAGSIANTWKVYQPSIPFVSVTNIGRDNTVTWPQDVGGSNCVFRLTDNYLYNNILFPDPANYTGPSNGWAVGNVGAWFSPKDLPGCTLWLDANDPNATGVPAANGATISTWRDKSGLGSDGTATGTPTITSTGLNNRPTMNFSGSTWFAGSIVNTGPTMTAFVVLQHPVVTTASFIRFLSMAPAAALDQNAGGILAELTGSATIVVANGNASSEFSQPDNTPYIMGFQADRTNLIAYLNGTAQAGTASTTSFNITRYRIGSMVGNNLNIYTGKISEVLIYSNALTPVQRAQVENYLSQKWGVAVSSTALTHAFPYNTCNVTANYTQVGSYISYTVTTPADDTGATNAGRPYIYSIVPSWNGTNGNTVNTDTESPIRLYKPTTPGGLAASGQGNSFTLNWQSAVIWTSPVSTVIPSYLLQVGPTTVSASYPTQSFNVVGNTKMVNGFDSSAGALTISLTAVTPLGYINPIYGNPATIAFTVPSGTSVSIIQSTTNAETLIVNVPLQFVGAQRTWFFITGTGRGGQSTTSVVSNIRTYQTNSPNYSITVSLGYNYTISAALTTSTTSPPTPADPSAPANPNPFPAKTLIASGITVTHDACSVALSWSAVSGAEYYNVYSANNGERAPTGFGRANIPTTTNPSITILNNGGTPTQQFAANQTYSYVIQSVTLSTNRFNPATNTVLSTNIESDFASSLPVTMYIPTNPTVAQLILTQSFANIIANWTALDSFPKDNAADIGIPSYTISCQTFTSSITTTGTTATFVGITPGTSYQISLNTRYKGFFGVTPTTTTFVTTAPTITFGPTLTNTGTAQIRVNASAATVGFWFLISGNTETLMNSPATVASNQITSNFATEKATTYTRNVKFVTQDTGLSVSAATNTVTTPNLTVSASVPVVATGDRAFSITLSHSGTAVGGIVWDTTTPTGTTFLTGSTTTNPTTLTYRFTNAAWSTNLSATFTSIILSNNGFTFPYIAPLGTTTRYTPPNLNIPTPTLANSAGALVLSATTTGGCNVNWVWPSYSVAGTATTPATTLTVMYGALGNTGTTYSAGAALSLSFGGYTNSFAQTSLPTFKAPTFSISSVTFADPNLTTKIIRLTASFGTFDAGTTGGTTRPQWTLPSTTLSGGGFIQLSTTGTLNPTTSPATLDYSNTSSGLSYAIAANVISLSYQGISISYGFLLTASSPNISLALSGTYSGTTMTVNATNASGVVGNWSLGTITPALNNPYTITQTPANPTATPTITITPGIVGTTYTIPVNFSFNNGQFTSTSSTSINILAVAGTAPITGATFTYLNTNCNIPNGFNVTYTTSGFTGSVSTPVSIGCTTPSAAIDQNYNNFSPRILIPNTTNNANVQKGDLKVNTVYQINTAQSVNENLGTLSTRNVVMPGDVTNVKWGSTSTANDNALATPSTFWISWTPIAPDAGIASRFRYMIYSLPRAGDNDSIIGYMYGDFIGGGMINITNINVDDAGRRLYLAVEGIHTKMVNSVGTARYYQGTIADYTTSKWTNGIDAGGNYLVILKRSVSTRPTIGASPILTLTAPNVSFPITQSNIQFRVPVFSSGSQSYFIGVIYTDPATGSQWLSPSSSTIRFTWGSATYTSGTNTFNVANARTFANITAVGGGGGSGNTGNGAFTSHGGGGGGTITVNGYRGIQQGDSIFVAAGGGGADGAYDNDVTATGGQGGSANGVVGKTGTKNGNGNNNNATSGSGIGGGGGGRQWSITNRPCG